MEMNKWAGEIGYEKTIEKQNSPGVFIPTIIKLPYVGDSTYDKSSWQASDGLNDSISINKKISIIADPFAFENFQHIKFAEYMGSYWKVISAEPMFPRIILTLGGMYNGAQS